MCGIAGIYQFNRQTVTTGHIESMIEALHHRGPDDSGIENLQHVALGFVRLSIIDLSHDGHQPMLSEDRRFVLTFNGEIFNYIELREELIQAGYQFKTQTDTEVLLKSYMHWGEDCLSKFNGMWSFVIYDKEKDEVFGARDRFGVKPFYYWQSESSVYWCSEIPPLLSVFPGKPEANEQAVFDYMVFNRTDQTEATFFRHIKKMQHGHCFVLNQDGFKLKQWYDLRNEVSKARGFANSNEFFEMFKSSIALRLRSDVPIGICLSGGLDSSAILATVIDEFGMDSLSTFSAVYDKGDVGDESPFIDEFNDKVKFMHRVYPDDSTLANDLDKFVEAHGEPIPSTGPYAQFKVMELAKGKVVVTLDGQGADEQLAGYHYFFGFYFKDLFLKLRWGRLCLEIYKNYQNHKSLFGLKSFVYFLLPTSIKTKSRVSHLSFLTPEFVKKYSLSNEVAGNIYGSRSLNDALLDHFEYKLEHLLKWEDRNSMYFSLEARVPFLDYRLVERMLASQANMKIKDGMTKSVLREAMIGKLPEKIRLRMDKTGFDTPQDRWFREPKWQEMISTIILSDSFAARRIIEVQQAKKLLDDHRQGKVQAAKELWKMIHLELWYRKFIDPVQ